jgi:hypothetical protein
MITLSLFGDQIISSCGFCDDGNIYLLIFFSLEVPEMQGVPAVIFCGTCIIGSVNFVPLQHSYLC